MNNLIKTGINETITSLELCNQINVFRSQLEGKSELAHADLLKVIRDEFEEELGEGKISLSSYKTSQNKDATMYILTLSQAKQVLVRESKHVRKAVIQYIEQLENQIGKASYMIDDPIERAKIWIEEQREKTRLENEMKEKTLLIEQQRPKVLFAEAVTASKSSILVSELAKILKANGVEDIGGKRLFHWMRQNGYLVKRNGCEYNMPTQKSMELRLFEIKETVVQHSDGHVSVNKTPKITGKGQQYFVNKFLSVEKEM